MWYKSLHINGLERPKVGDHVDDVSNIACLHSHLLYLHPRHDFNQSYNAPAFRGLPEGGMEQIEDAWAAYAKAAFNADADADSSVSEDERPVKKKHRGPTEVTHTKDGAPFLPDIRESSLAESKQLIREFLTGHYSKLRIHYC